MNLSIRRSNAMSTMMLAGMLGFGGGMLGRNVNLASKLASIRPHEGSRKISSSELIELLGSSNPNRGQGADPKTWGMSAQCARMQRSNKLRALGIGGQKI